MFTDNQIETIIDFLCTVDDETKIYFGCDSLAYKKSIDQKTIWFAKFATVMIVHVNGNNGCRIFRHVDHERVYDSKKNRPSDRLMKEVYRVTALYNQMIPFINQFETEIHVDISRDELHGSSCVATQAAGYILGMTGSEPKLKPDSWAASFGADGIGRGFDTRSHSQNVTMQ